MAKQRPENMYSDVPWIRELEEMPPLDWRPLGRDHVLAWHDLRIIARHLFFEISTDLETLRIVDEPDDGEVSDVLQSAIECLDESVKNIMHAVRLMREHKMARRHV